MSEERKIKTPDEYQECKMEKKEITKRSDKRRSANEELKHLAEKRAKMNEREQDLHIELHKEELMEIVSDLRKAEQIMNVCMQCSLLLYSVLSSGIFHFY